MNLVVTVKSSPQIVSQNLPSSIAFPVTVRGTPRAVDGVISIGGDAAGQEWFVPAETPVAFVYNRRNYAVMLATPDDLVDYALGFSLTEGVVENTSDIQSLDIIHSDMGVDFRMTIAASALEKFDLKQRRRNLPGRAGCGLCGLENADTLRAVLPKVSNVPMQLDAAAMQRALGGFSSHQPINARTKSVHGAAWCNLSGDILLAREDVGRHNAMDKVLGALALSDIDTKNGFILLSSRCSYELVEKAARRGIGALLTLSGPTQFAIDKAREANIGLYGRSKKGAVLLTI